MREEFMKKKEVKHTVVKMIGKNCKWNKERLRSYLKDSKIMKRKIHYCYFTLKICGLKHDCDCFDNNRKLSFKRK